MSNRTDIVVETDNAEGQVLLSASRVYDLTEDKTQDTINSEVGSSLTSLGNTLNQLKTDTFGNINLAGTNTTGSTIAIGTFFYNNGVLVSATAEIQNGSTITSSNTQTVTAGGLNALKTQFSKLTLSCNFPIIGRMDGKIVVILPVQGVYTSFSLSATSGISVDIYGNASFGNIICDFDSEHSSVRAGSIYLMFTPRTSYSSYLSTGKIGIASFYGNITVNLS